MEQGLLSVPKRILKKVLRTLCSFLLRTVVTPLPKMEFDVLTTIWEKRLMPMILIELIIIDGELSRPINELRVLLRFRKDSYFKDWNQSWHHPGGILGSNETFREAIDRIAQKELGAKIKIKKFYAVGALNFFKCKREHEVGHIFICIPENINFTNDPNIQYFKFSEIPKNFIPQHYFIQEKAEQWIKIFQSLDDNQRRSFIQFSQFTDNDSEN